MTEQRIGRQTPTRSYFVPYEKTKGKEASDYYRRTKRTPHEWQCLLLDDIMAVNDDGLWAHSKVGYSVSRRNGKNETYDSWNYSENELYRINGKNEIIAMREQWGLLNGEHILHTAHRTQTSHTAWERLCLLLDDLGVEYKATKQLGNESIVVEGGGRANFRTRSAKGGLGEGYDLLIIDEAQEYTLDQESAIKYVVSASQNPQTLMCGTPPTPISSGTVFTKFRKTVLETGGDSWGWAEWSVEDQTDPHNKDAWYETNPSLGLTLRERAVQDEIGDDDVDFNIQRLGLWIKYNQKSAISKREWAELATDVMPDIHGSLFVGIKYGHDGTNVAMSIAVKTTDGRIFVEAIDCREIRQGNQWIVDFLRDADAAKVVVDGANGQATLEKDLKDARIKPYPILPTVREIISANACWEQGIYQQTICHRDQPSLSQVISNCEKRAIGTNGGFGYKALREDLEIALMDSVILAYWQAVNARETSRQTITY